MGKRIRKKNNRVMMRVDRDVKQELQKIKIYGETDAEFLERISKIFSNRGIPREIGHSILKLQQIADVYVCPELHETLEYLRSILVDLSREPNQENRVHEARVITNFLKNRLDGIQKNIEDYKR